MNTLNSKQTAPKNIKGYCNCGNTRQHTRAFYRAVGWLYECPSCGTFATAAQIADRTRRVAVLA